MFKPNFPMLTAEEETCSFFPVPGQFLSDKKCGVKVELEMYGIANDSVRRKHQTKTIMNSVCPRWDSEAPFVFPKVSSRTE